MSLGQVPKRTQMPNALRLGKRQSPTKRVFTRPVIGLALLMFQGAHDVARPTAWIGDLLFIAAGGLSTSYTLMLHRWEAEPVLAVSAVNVISGLAYLPIYLFLTHGHVPDVSRFAFRDKSRELSKLSMDFSR